LPREPGVDVSGPDAPRSGAKSSCTWSSLTIGGGEVPPPRGAEVGHCAEVHVAVDYDFWPALTSCS